jgi:hypothetical protein
LVRSTKNSANVRRPQLGESDPKRPLSAHLNQLSVFMLSYLEVTDGALRIDLPLVGANIQVFPSRACTRSGQVFGH